MFVILNNFAQPSGTWCYVMSKLFIFTFSPIQLIYLIHCMHYLCIFSSNNMERLIVTGKLYSKRPSGLIKLQSNSTYLSVPHFIRPLIETDREKLLTCWNGVTILTSRERLRRCIFYKLLYIFFIFYWNLVKHEYTNTRVSLHFSRI